MYRPMGQVVHGNGECTYLDRRAGMSGASALTGKIENRCFIGIMSSSIALAQLQRCVTERPLIFLVGLRGGGPI